MFYKLRVLLIIFLLIHLNNVSFSDVINQIDIKGNIRLDDDTIFSYLGIKKDSKISKGD